MRTIEQALVLLSARNTSLPFRLFLLNNTIYKLYCAIRSCVISFSLNMTEPEFPLWSVLYFYMLFLWHRENFITIFELLVAGIIIQYLIFEFIQYETLLI